MEPIILASGSIRRHEFFRLLGLPFSIMPSHVKEELVPGLTPREQAEAIARSKVAESLKLIADGNPPWILAADTIVSIDEEIFGKPIDREHAKLMLYRLSGREHEVITALALYNGKRKTIDCRSNISLVRFCVLSKVEIEWYLDSGEWQGVAGSYRLQGIGGCFISEIKGSCSSIVGLPLHEFYVMLRENGYDYSV
ncbi:MAG: Maf family protein [Treponemataceae bacterium]